VSLVALSIAALVSIPAAAPSFARIPFTWTPGQIEVAVRVNDAPATFLLDTASEFSVVSTRVAARLQLRLEPLHGRDFADDVALAIGPVSLAHERVMVMPFDGYYARGRNIDGLIGHDLFARFVVAIDFTGHRLTLWEPSAFKPPADAVVVAIEFVGRLATVRSTIKLSDGRSLNARLVIDTGASQGVILRYPFASNFVASASRRRPQDANSLASGTLSLVEVPVEEVSIGGWTFDHPDVLAHREPTGSGAFTSTDGLIGNTLLQRFQLFIDYPNQRLLLKPLRHRRSV
jgi:predicted aspartyl protease